MLLASLDRDRLREAFQVSPLQPVLRQQQNDDLPVGTQSCTWGNTYPDKLPSIPHKRKERIVDPTLKESEKGAYPTLGQALMDAEPGEVILIKHTGPLPVSPISIRASKAGSLEVITVKPYPACHPVITLDSALLDTALFHLQGARIAFDSLEFYLHPDKADFKAQAVATLMGDSQCVFENCVMSLERDADKNTILALVTLADPSNMMPGPGSEPAPVPQVRLENCFVRGDGDLVSVQAGRPFDLDVENSLIVLNGSFLATEGGRSGSSAKTSVKLSHVTSYLTNHLVRLRAGKDDKTYLPVRFNPVHDCLFLAAGNKSLVHFDGTGNSEELKMLFNRLGWEA